jgi:amidophosphoribosyltransferase
MSGLFGIVTPGNNCTQDLLYGTDYHSHLGTEYGGIAVLGHEYIRRLHRITNSQFKTEFLPDQHLFNGPIGIGVISEKDQQPLQINPVNKDIGLFTLAMCGYVTNANDFVEEFRTSGIGFECEHPRDVNITKLVGMLISQSDNLVSGIQKMFYRINGSVTLIIISGEGIIAARSLYGHSTLYLGRRKNDWAITSETTALPNLNFVLERCFKPGEIIFLDGNGPKTVSSEYHNKTQLCPFFPVYTAFPSAEYGDTTAEGYRQKAGAYHACCDCKQGICAQMVAGMADSGTAYAIGYARQSQIDTNKAVLELVHQHSVSPVDQLDKQIESLLSRYIPYQRPLVKYTPGWGRSYTPPNQIDRDRVAKMKQIPVKDIWDDLTSLILTEDSIVRGTQLKRYFVQLRHIIEKIWHKQWPDIHVRIGCPPLMWPCRYMYSTRKPEELAARRAVAALLGYIPSDDQMRDYVDSQSSNFQQMVDWLTEDIGAKSIRYMPLNEMIELMDMNSDEVCTYCWNGEGV